MDINIIRITRRNSELYQREFGQEKEHVEHDDFTTKTKTHMRNQFYIFSELSKGHHHAMMYILHTS